MSRSTEVKVDDGLDLNRYIDDFPGFCRLLDVLGKSGQRQKLTLWPIQERYCLARTPRDILCKPRQIGMTILEQARDVWFFLLKPGTKTVVVCQSVTGDGPLKELSARFSVMFQSLAEQGVKLDFHNESASEWTLPDRDSSLRIVPAGASDAAAQKKGRSGTINRLHVTELAFYEHPDATMKALLACVPPVAYGSEIVLETTPNGASGYYYETYKAALDGNSTFKPHFWPWFQQPEYRLPLEPGERIYTQSEREVELVLKYGVTAEQLKWYRDKIREAKGDTEAVDEEFPTNVETAFRMRGKLFFQRDVTAAMIGQAVEPVTVDGELHIWRHYEAPHPCIVVVDPSEGIDKDFGAITVWLRATGEMMARLRGQHPTWKLAAIAAEIGYRFGTALIIVERNNHGHAVLQALTMGIPADPDAGREAMEAYPNVYVGFDNRPGWVTSEVTRSNALEALEAQHRARQLYTRDALLLGELLTFVRNPKKNGRAEAAKGAHDDVLMTAAIAYEHLTKPHRAYSGVMVPSRAAVANRQADDDVDQDDEEADIAS